jgi:hypothetical protein
VVIVSTRDEVRRLLAEGKKQVEVASELGISPGRVSQLVKEIKSENVNTQIATSAPSVKIVKKDNSGKREKKEIHPHDGRRGNGGKPPPGPNGSGFQKGNDLATVTGEFRDPFLHGVSEEQKVMAAVPEDVSTSTLLRQSIGGWRLQILDMRREIEAIKNADQKWWWLGSTYTREEGDGEIKGTGRISQRKRVPKEEALKVMIEALSRVQGKHDSAVEKLHNMIKDSKGDRKKGSIAAILSEMDADEAGDDD